MSPIGPDATIDLQVAGEGGVPSTGVVAVAMNLTSTLADSMSFITAYPTGTARPTTSNLNVAPGIDTPNQVIVGLGTDGKVSLYNEAGNGHLVADVTGYFLGGSGLEPVTPARLLDTRNDIGVTTGIVGPDSTISFDATEGVDSAVLNVTATGPTEPGWATVYPGGSPRPNTSTVNLDPLSTRRTRCS